MFTNTDAVSDYDGRSGKGGDITINANTLRVLDKAVVSARTRSDGNGGNITVNTNNLEVTGGGQILTSAFGSGSAGNITVNSTNKVTISGSDPTFTERSNRINPFFPEQKYSVEVDNDGSASGLLARVQGNQTANAGNIEVTSGSIRLDNGATHTFPL